MRTSNDLWLPYKLQRLAILLAAAQFISPNAQANQSKSAQAKAQSATVSKSPLPKSRTTSASAGYLTPASWRNALRTHSMSRQEYFNEVQMLRLIQWQHDRDSAIYQNAMANPQSAERKAYEQAYLTVHRGTLSQSRFSAVSNTRAHGVGK